MCTCVLVCLCAPVQQLDKQHSVAMSERGLGYLLAYIGYLPKRVFAVNTFRLLWLLTHTHIHTQSFVLFNTLFLLPLRRLLVVERSKVKYIRVRNKAWKHKILHILRRVKHCVLPVVAAACFEVATATC